MSAAATTGGRAWHALCLLGAVSLSSMPAYAQHPAFDCLIEPSETIDIRSPVTGIIDKVHVARGSAVKQRDLLVNLESSVEQAAADLARYKSEMDGAIKSAESRLEHAKRKLRRQSGLAAQKYVSAQDQEDADAELRIAEADVLSAQENKQLARLEYSYAASQLALRQIHSPFDGVVVEQSQYPGELAEIGDNKPSILKLARIDPLRVKVILPLAMYPKMKVGMRADVVPEAPLEGHYEATIDTVDQVIDAASGTFQVRMNLPNPQRAVPGGVKCRVSFPAL